MVADPTAVLVTGAKGFLGRHVVAALRDDGRRVILLGRAELSGDLGAVLRSAVPPSDPGRTVGLIHLAAAGVSPRTATSEELRSVNVELPARLIGAASGAGVTRVITVGTAAEYGTSGDDHPRVPPDAALRPVSSYACSKVDGFRRSVDAALADGTTLHHVRVFNAFGPGQQTPALWAALERSAGEGRDLDLSSGTQVRDFIRAEEVARRIVAVLSERPALGRVTVRNVGTGEGRTVRAFAEDWWERFGAGGELRFGSLPDRTDEPARLVADPDRVAVLSAPIEAG